MTWEERKKYQEEMLEERDRVKGLFQKRGIREYEHGVDSLDRVVKIENVVDCVYEMTWFKIPEDIDLEKVATWFVHDTKFHECTLFLSGWNPTTVRCDRDISYFFKYAPAAHEKFLMEGRK